MPVTGGHACVSIDVGGSSTLYAVRACGVTAAGEAYCWGSNTNGELGIGTTAETSIPTAVAGGFRFAQLSLGHGFTCGVTATAEAYCWGINNSSQLGDGGTVASSSPVRVATSERFVTISAGVSGACALTAAGEPFCWGARSGAPTSATPTPLPGNHRFTSISHGLSHACGLTASGETWCWGQGSAVGDGSELGNASAPVRVRSTAVHRALSAGFHSCVLIATDEIHCWGNNSWGQLGVGHRTSSPVPIRANLLGAPPGAPNAISANTSTEGSAAVGSLVGSGGPVPWNIRVRVTDANGIAVAGVPVTFTATGGGTATEQAVTSATGVAFAVWRLGPAVGPQTLHANAAGLAGSPVVFTANAVAPGPPASFPIITRRTLPVGTRFEFQFPLPGGYLRDAAGYAVAGASVRFSRINASGSTIVPTLPATVTTDADGGAFLSSWVIDTIAGIDSLRIDVTGIAQPEYFVLTRDPLQVSTLEFSQQPLGGSAGAPMAPVRVTARDRYGNIVTWANAPYTLALLGGTAALGGTTSVIPVNGTATFSDLTVSSAGTYQLRATVATITVTSAPFTITP